jgi:hypothetical protein
LAVGLGATAAQAAAGPQQAPAAATTLAQQVHGLLVHNPGAVQISPDSVELPGQGIVLGVADPSPHSGAAVTPDSASGVCPAQWVCLFKDSAFRGGFVKFFNCGTWFNLSNYFMSNGSSWANQASSIDNPQSGGVVSFFRHGSGGTQLQLNAGHYLTNLQSDSGPNPNPGANHNTWNDWITQVHAC